MHLSAAGKNLIILDSFKTAVDLMDKRSSIYSGRTHMTMLMDVWVKSSLSLCLVETQLRIALAGIGVLY